MGVQGLRDVAADLKEEKVKHLPREMINWANGNGKANKPPWGMPRCVVYPSHTYVHMNVDCLAEGRPQEQAGGAKAPCAH